MLLDDYSVGLAYSNIDGRVTFGTGYREGRFIRRYATAVSGYGLQSNWRQEFNFGDQTPVQGDVTSVLFFPSGSQGTYLVGTREGLNTQLWRSVDHGIGSFDRVEDFTPFAPSGGEIYSMVYDPVAERVIMAFLAYPSNSTQIFISDNGGVTWSEVENAIEDKGLIRRMVYVTSGSGIIIGAGADYTKSLDLSGAVWRSMDSGENWTRVHTFDQVKDPYYARSVQGLGYFPSAAYPQPPVGNGVLLAGMYPNSSIWRSVDMGSHWEMVAELIESQQDRINDFAFHHQLNKIFAVGGTIGKVWVSSDAGKTWTEDKTRIINPYTAWRNITDIIYDPTTKKMIAAGGDGVLVWSRSFNPSAAGY